MSRSALLWPSPVSEAVWGAAWGASRASLSLGGVGRAGCHCHAEEHRPRGLKGHQDVTLQA